MNCIDLTLSEEDDIAVVKNKKYNENLQSYAPSFHQINNPISNFFYGTEDLSETYLSIQYPLHRKIVKNHYSIKCPKCPDIFFNCNFVNHIIDHFKCEYSSLDQLLFPKVANLSNTVFNDQTVNGKQTSHFQCEICILDFNSPIGLGQHLEQKHVYQDMPYICFVCNFYRTSILSQLQQHFYDYHRFTEFLICPFCLQPFELSPSLSDGSILDATSFVVHLERHLTRKQFFCDRCVLKYPTKCALIFHKTVYHCGKEIPSNINGNGTSIECPEKSGQSANKIIKKSLNVINQPIDVSKLSINSYRLPMACAECRETFPSSMNLAQHYQSFSMCTQCGFRSYCSVSFRKHTRTFHTFQSECLNYKSIDIYQKGVLICECGHQSMHGDSMASHLYRCLHKTCFTRPRIETENPKDSRMVDNNLAETHRYFAAINLQKCNASGKQ